MRLEFIEAAMVRELMPMAMLPPGHVSASAASALALLSSKIICGGMPPRRKFTDERLAHRYDAPEDLLSFMPC